MKLISLSGRRTSDGGQAPACANAQPKISFHDWLKLAPEETKPDGAELMYIIPSKPLEV